ncbi:MAG: heme-binding protein [Lachnospiraceae bacterium]
MKEAEVKSIVSAVMQQTQATHMTLAIAAALMNRIEKKAAQMGVSAVVAVSNDAARPVAVHCMDDSYIASYDVALQKSYTVVALKMSTAELKPLSQPGGSLYGIQYTNQGQIVIFGGGEPLWYQGRLIGGLGVSGGTEEQDSALAQYGAECIEEVILWQSTNKK